MYTCVESNGGAETSPRDESTTAEMQKQPSAETVRLASNEHIAQQFLHTCFLIDMNRSHYPNTFG